MATKPKRPLGSQELKRPFALALTERSKLNPFKGNQTMARKGHRKATQPLDSVNDRFGWQSLLNAHVAALEVKNFSKDTISQRIKYVRWFALWCIERGATKPGDVVKALVERYQRYLVQPSGCQRQTDVVPKPTQTSIASEIILQLAGQAQPYSVQPSV